MTGAPPLLRRALGAGLASLWLGAMPAAGGQAPQRVTSDTQEYCQRLQDRMTELVQANGPPSEQIATLSSEGQRMCDQGQTRGGILRLRKALLMMKGQGD